MVRPTEALDGDDAIILRPIASSFADVDMIALQNNVHVYFQCAVGEPTAAVARHGVSTLCSNESPNPAKTIACWANRGKFQSFSLNEFDVNARAAGEPGFVGRDTRSVDLSFKKRRADLSEGGGSSCSLRGLEEGVD